MSGNSEAERANGMARSQWIVAGIAGVVLAFGVAFGDSAIVRMLATAAGGGALLWLCLRDKGERPQTEAPAPESIAQETPAPEVHAHQMPEPHPDPEVDPEPAISEAPPAPQLGADVDSHSESNGDGAAIQGLVRAKIGTGDQALDVHHGALNRFMSSGPANIVLLDETGVVLEYSQAFSDLAGVSVTLIGNTVASLFEEDAQVAVLDALTVFLAGVDAAAPLASLDDPLEGPLIARLATGPKETCAVIFSELQSNPRIIALSLLNVTQEKKLEAQFAQSQKMLAVGQLAGGIAHDFNNLLTAIIGHCDLLMLRHSPSDESFADINQVKQNANRAANLVRQLLAFSRRQTLQPQVLDVGDVLSDLGNLLNRLLGAARSMASVQLAVEFGLRTRIRPTLSSATLAMSLFLWRRRSAGLVGDDLVMLRPAMSGEIEDGRFVECAIIQIRIRHDQFIAERARLGHNFSRRRHNHATAHQLKPIFRPSLGDANHPGAILVRPHLHRHVIVHHTEMRRLRPPAVA